MANTGYKGWTTLEEYFVDSGVATGKIKLNVSGDPHYVASIYNETFCPIVDTIKPSTPTSAIGSNITSTTLTLDWGTSTDNVGVINYEVYQNGILLATLGNVLTYNVTGLIAATNYAFVIYSKDAAGNYSLPSPTYNVTTASIVDTQAPTTPSITSVTQANEEMSVAFTNSTDNIGIEGYEIWRQVDGGEFYFHDYIPNSTSPYIDYNVLVGYYYNYGYKIRAYDAAQNFSEYSNITTKTMI